MRKIDRIIKEFLQPRKNLLESIVAEELENVLKQSPAVDDLAPVVIDLNVAKEKKLDESFLYMLGGWIETILGRMFGMNSIPVTVKGTQSQISSFSNVLNSEKRYIDAWHKFGLDDPRTYGSKAQVENAAKNFERTTGIKWPFKG